MSGAAQRDNDARALQEERLREAADPYFIPQGTEEELGRLDYPRLQQLVIRHEGGLLGRPTSRVDAVSRILAAGYSLQKEAAHMAKQRKVDAAAEVKAQAARAAALVAQAAAKVRADAAAVEAEARWVAGAGERQAAVERKQAKLAEIDKQFAEGTLNIPVLTVAELQTILQRKRLDTRGVKAVLRDRLTAAMREQAGLVQRNAEATHSEG
ncbi:hypothetical protein B484DRAFT_404331 [Ochromonadaceae sp. CCMP2298]|nr:hypothetical protein B484DRAFT_404331 [Ochromonadaceae sp. CCMP2298]